MKRALFLIAALFTAVAARAAVPPEEPRVFLRAEAAPKEIHIGDRVEMTITASYSGPVEAAEQKFEKTAGDFEILATAPAPVKEDKTDRRSKAWKVLLTTFSTGTVTVPPIAVTFQKADGTFVEARTAEIPITVKSTLAEKGDKGGLMPAKGLYNVRSFWWAWALGAVALIGLLAWLLSLRTPQAVVAPEKEEPKISPEDEARQALDALQAEAVTEETIKEYYFRLSRILRRYIERRYNVSALEMTTSELLAASRKLDLSLSAALPIREFLESADLVKFAKVMPSADEVPADVARVRAFVDYTTPVTPTAAEAKVAASREAPPL